MRQTARSSRCMVQHSAFSPELSARALCHLATILLGPLCMKEQGLDELMKQDEPSRHAHQTGPQALADMQTYHEKQPTSRGREDRGHHPWKEWRNQPADEVDDGDQFPPLGSLLGPLVIRLPPFFPLLISPLVCRFPPFFPLLISPLVCILFCCDSIR